MKQMKQLRPKDSKRTLIRLFSYFKFNKGLFFGGIFFIIFSAAAEIGANGMLSPIIDSLITNSDRSLFIRYIMIMAILVVIISLGQYFGNLFMAKLAQKTVHKIRQDMFSHMEKLSISIPMLMGN